MLNTAKNRIIVALAMGIVALVAILPVAAQQQGASATRSFSATTVDAGATVTVTIEFANTGGFGRITETLPAGFTYVSSSVADTNVTVTGQSVRFGLFQERSPITYTVTASGTAGSYDFSGTLRDSDRADHTVGGPTTVTVEGTAAEPTATPAPTAPPATTSATRSFSSMTVTAGDELMVTIAFANAGSLARITETLPAGFMYVSSTVADSNVTVTGQDVKFNLFQESSPFTYTVTASMAGSYDFSGKLRDADRNDHTVGGATSVTVLAAPEPTAPPGPSAMRSFASEFVSADGDVNVTITVANYGGFGRVTETLPAGFTYKSSDLDDSQVDASGGQTVSFTLQSDSSFTYVVSASGVAGAHHFSGELTDSDRMTHAVGGATSVTVQLPSGPASRAFAPTQVLAGGTVTVTINAGDYGGFGRVTETLPTGFTYVSSSLDAVQVMELGGNRVRFTLQGEESFTYEVTAPTVLNTYIFLGVLTNSDRVDTSVGGTSSIRVGTAAPPPPAPATPVPPPPAVPTAVPPPADANVRPTFDDGIVQERSIGENAGAGANVGDPVTATDAKGDELTYLILGDDATHFEIDSSTGQITVGEGTTLDFETRSSYSVTVRAQDPLGLADIATATTAPTSTPAPTATRRPATATPVPTATMLAPTATAAPTATTPPPTATSAPTATPEPEPTMAPPTATTAPTAMPEPTATPEPEPTAAPTPAPTATTAPPAPTATTAPVEPEEEAGFPVVIILLIIVAIVVVAVIFFVVRRR